MDWTSFPTDILEDEICKCWMLLTDPINVYHYVTHEIISWPMATFETQSGLITWSLTIVSSEDKVMAS